MELSDGMVADDNSNCLPCPGGRFVYLDFIIKIKGTVSISGGTSAFSQQKTDIWNCLPDAAVLTCVEVLAEVVECSSLLTDCVEEFC